MRIEAFISNPLIQTLVFIALFGGTLHAQISVKIDSSNIQKYKAHSLEQLKFQHLDTSLTQLEIDSNGILWIIGKDTLLYDGQDYFSYNSMNFADRASIKKTDKEVSFLQNIWPFANRSNLITDYHPDDQLIYIFQSGNLYAFQHSEKGVAVLKQLMKGIPLKDVTALKKDAKTGIFFLANAKGEVYKLHPKYFTNWYLKEEGNEAINSVYNILSVGKDSIFSDKGILFTPNNSKIITEPFERIGQDYLGRIWGYRQAEATKKFYLDKKDNFKKHEFDKEENVPFENKTILDSNQGIWSLSFSLKTNNSIVSYYHPIKQPIPKTIPTYPDFNLTDALLIYNKSNHSLLMTAWGDTAINLVELDITAFENGESHFLTVKPGFILSFRYSMRDIYLDNDYNYWASLRGNGYFKLVKDSLHLLPLDEHKYLKYAHKILEDEHNYFWISTNNGIIRAYRPELEAWLEGKTDQVYYHHYGYENGIESRELNGIGVLSGIKTDDYFAFASLRGPIVFKPEKIPLPQCANTLIVKRFKIDEKLQSFSNGLIVSHNFGMIEFHISTPFLGHTNNHQKAEFQFANADGHWQQLKKDGKLILNNLPPGNYNLKLRLKAGFGINNYVYRNLEFTVAGIWYTSRWFKGSIIVALFLSIGGYFWFRSILAHRSQKELEAEVKKQTSTQSELNIELKFNNAQLNKIQAQNEKLLNKRDRLIGLYIHDIRGPLHFISNVANSALLDLQSLSVKKYQKRIQMLTQAASGIFSQSERMYKWITSENRVLNYSPQPFNLRSVAQECNANFLEVAGNKGINIQINVPPHLSLNSDKNVVMIALGNILDNAIKFSKAGGKITITAIEQESFLSISIVDNGIGMDKDKITQLASGSFSNSTEGTQGEKGKGYGIKAIYELLNVIGAFMEIESKPNHGTSISLFFQK